jgi:O-succinylbenzoic acid--CoA ligase
MLSEAGMTASARASAENLGWNEDDRWWLCMPTAHVGGLAIIARCLLAGRAVFVSERFSTDAYERALAERVTLLSLVPTMLHRLIKSGAPMPDSRVRAILVGGGPCSPTLTAKARELGFPVLLTWGMSEAGSQIATQSPSCRFSSKPTDLSSVGRPLLGFDFDNRDGVAWLRGPALTLGYHPPGRYEQPFDADGWLESRDRVTVLEDGQLRILGRGTDMIVSGGENVYPAEVESVLTACDGVVAACVVGIPHPHWGEEVLAVVVVSGDLDRDRLILEARVRLGGYKTPRRVLSVDALPTNVNGKVDRLAIRRWAVERLA